MAGCRRLSDQEFVLVRDSLTKPRDRLLFVMGVRTGFRISEMLRLKIEDVLGIDGRVLSRVSASCKNGKKRSVKLHGDVIALLQVYVIGKERSDFLFPSQRGGALTRYAAHNILKGVYNALGLRENENGRLATHSMRKTFANNVFEGLDRDVLKTMRALGHDRPENTVRYLEIDQPEIDDAITSV